MSELRFFDPAEYKITVKGAITEDMKSILNSVDVVEFHKRDQVLSSVVFSVKDQAGLSGVLNALYSNHYVILKVESLEPKVFGNGNEIAQGNRVVG
jgi:hypothetical protein